MENYKEEIEKLQTQLDELKSKIEKPEFKVGKWYKTNNDKALYFIKSIDFDGNQIENYGFDYEGYWMSCKYRNSANADVRLATPKEVEDALIKEAVKRGLIGLSKVKDCGLSITNPDDIISNNPNYEFVEKDNELWVKTIKDFNMSIFLNGIWATPIKTKTIDEILNEASYLSISNLRKYLTENKQDIIETLNSL